MSKVEKIKGEIGRRIEEICDLTTGYIMDSKTTAEYRLLYELASFINSLEEEPVSNDLEEAAKNYEEDAIFYAARRISDYFKAGAQWQKERDQKTIELAEDHAYLAGQEKIIAKACEWLENYFKGVSSGTVYLEDFKKAIKE